MNDIEKVKEQLWTLWNVFHSHSQRVIDKEQIFKQAELDVEALESKYYLAAKAENPKLTIAELEAKVIEAVRTHKLETLKKEADWKREKVEVETISYRIQLIRSLADVLISENYGTSSLQKVEDKRSKEVQW